MAFLNCSDKKGIETLCVFLLYENKEDGEKLACVWTHNLNYVIVKVCEELCECENIHLMINVVFPLAIIQRNRVKSYCIIVYSSAVCKNQMKRTKSRIPVQVVPIRIKNTPYTKKYYILFSLSIVDTLQTMSGSSTQ